MTRHRSIVSILAATAVCMLCPSLAVASPLLSGYGGPGGGDQAILGSMLLPGSSGGGGGGAAVSGGGSGTGQGGSSGSALEARSDSRRSGSASHRSGKASKPPSPAYAPSAAPPTAGGLSDAGDLSVMGLSGVDLLLIALVSVALALTAGLMRGLVKPQN